MQLTDGQIRYLTLLDKARRERARMSDGEWKALLRGELIRPTPHGDCITDTGIMVIEPYLDRERSDG